MEIVTTTEEPNGEILGGDNLSTASTGTYLVTNIIEANIFYAAKHYQTVPVKEPLSPEKSSMFSTRKSQEVSWKGVNFTVKKSGRKVLTDCWGHASAGTTCAILGPSGAGTYSNYTIRYNGMPLREVISS